MTEWYTLSISDRESQYECPAVRDTELRDVSNLKVRETRGEDFTDTGMEGRI